MSHKFLTFPTNWSLESSFRDAYLALTSEAIQANPQQNADGSMFMIGSARLNDAHTAQLLGIADFAPLIYIGEALPSNWVPKDETPPE